MKKSIRKRKRTGINKRDISLGVIGIKIFIFDYVSELTDNHHNGGGLAVIAADEGRAKELISTNDYIKLTNNDWDKVNTYELIDNNVEEKLFIFPDAGCC